VIETSRIAKVRSVSASLWIAPDACVLIPKLPTLGAIVASGARVTPQRFWEESMRMLATIAVAKGLAALALVGAGTADAAEIKMLVSNALKTTLEELAPQFETASEHKLAITFGA